MNCLRLNLKKHEVLMTKSPIPLMENEDEVIIKITAAGICATDHEIMQGQMKVNDGVVLGHEIVGTVFQVSQKCSTLRIGDRVAVNPNLFCDECQNCRRGLYNFCKKGELGFQVDGGWAEYCKSNTQLVHLLPSNVSFDQAVLCEPLSCVVHAFNRISLIDKESKILVIGAGIIGILFCFVLNLKGFEKVRVVEVCRNRKKMFNDLKLGYDCLFWEEISKNKEDECNGTYNMCIECSGNSKALEEAVSVLANNSTLLLFGIGHPAAGESCFPIYQALKKEISVIPAYSCSLTDFREAVELLGVLVERFNNFENLTTQKFSVSQYDLALEKNESECVKKFFKF